MIGFHYFLFIFVTIILFTSCSPPPPSPKPVVVVEPPKPPEPNLDILVDEAVDSPEHDWLAKTKFYLDGTLIGQTEPTLKSQEAEWKGHVSSGNRLLKIERWSFPRVWDWVRLPDDQQPHERFVRIKPGMRTKVAVRFTDDARQNSLQVTQEKLPE